MRLHVPLVLVALCLGCAARPPPSGADAGANVTAPEATAGAAARSDSASAAADAGSGASQEACIDAWLKARGLNPYGDPPDTMYAGGDPTFDETTGARTSRVEWVLRRQPGARDACDGSKAAPP